MFENVTQIVQSRFRNEVFVRNHFFSDLVSHFDLKHVLILRNNGCRSPSCHSCLTLVTPGASRKSQKVAKTMYCRLKSWCPRFSKLACLFENNCPNSFRKSFWRDILRSPGAAGAPFGLIWVSILLLFSTFFCTITVWRT